jgi:hypothetical protein
MTRKNMALRAGGRNAMLTEVSKMKNKRTGLRNRLKKLPKQDLVGYVKQYTVETGLKPYAGLLKGGKAVRSPTHLDKPAIIDMMVDAEFPKAQTPKEYTRAELEAMRRNELIGVAKALGIKGKGTSKVLINAIMKRDDAVEDQREEAREAGRLRLISGKGLKRSKRKRSGYDAVRHGKGPFRYVIVKGGRIVVDAGPVPTAREASIAAKTLLRTKAKAFVHPISQAAGNRLVSAGSTGLEAYGRVVDGYIVENLAGRWESFIYQPNTTAIAYAGSRGFDRLIPTGSKVTPLSLMNVPDDFYARPPAGKIAANRRNRRNGRTQEHSDDQLRYAMSTLADSAVKDFSSHRGSKAKAKSMIKDHYNRIISMHKSDAAGRRNLGGVSDWYDHARDM